MKRLRLIAAALCLLAANVIPVAASEGTDLPKVIDDAGILSDYDETRLSSQIDEMTQQYQIDIVLMTENRRQEGTAQAEADMQYVNRGYGIGEGKDGILFLLDMGSREWAISTNGAAMTMFSDYDLSALGDHAATGYFSSDQYYQGFQSYLKELDKTLERNLNPQKEENELGNALASAIADGQKEAESKEEEKAEEKAEETDAKPKEPKGPEDYIIPALVCGLILTILYMASLKSGMKTANMQKDAQDYQRGDAATQIRKRDIFLTSSITKKPIEQKQDNRQHYGSHNRTTLHKDKHGNMHGGASGKF